MKVLKTRCNSVHYIQQSSSLLKLEKVVRGVCGVGYDEDESSVVETSGWTQTRGPKDLVHRGKDVSTVWSTLRSGPPEVLRFTSGTPVCRSWAEVPGAPVTVTLVAVRPS